MIKFVFLVAIVVISGGWSKEEIPKFMCDFYHNNFNIPINRCQDDIINEDISCEDDKIDPLEHCKKWPHINEVFSLEFFADSWFKPMYKNCYIMLIGIGILTNLLMTTAHLIENPNDRRNPKMIAKLMLGLIGLVIYWIFKGFLIALLFGYRKITNLIQRRNFENINNNVDNVEQQNPPIPRAPDHLFSLDSNDSLDSYFEDDDSILIRHHERTNQAIQDIERILKEMPKVEESDQEN